MRIVMNGAEVFDVPSFIRCLAAAITGDAGTTHYFGFELHSLGDCLQGGFLGEPPYDILVEGAEPMLAAFGHAGWSRHCQSMLALIDAGGAGLVQEDSRAWYEHARADADRGMGPTLLDHLMDVIRSAPASLTLLAADGALLSRPTASTLAPPDPR